MKIRNIIALVLLFLASTMANAQKDVTTFLGIPVDGFKSVMRQKLIAKGYTPKKALDTEFFEGEFNGTQVNIYIGTNNNKVCRIMVNDANPMDEADIKIRFNRLVSQFEKNERYVHLDNYSIPESEDISYEMLVHHKTYEAAYFQNPDLTKMDTLAMQNKVKTKLLQRYSEEQIANPTEEIKNQAQLEAIAITTDHIVKKSVWFRINEVYGKYYISIFYDNEYNRANGEDL